MTVTQLQDRYKLLAVRYFQMLGYIVLEEGSNIRVSGSDGVDLVLSSIPVTDGLEETADRAQYVGPGSPILERIVHDLRLRGRVTRAYARFPYNDREVQAQLRQFMLAQLPGAVTVFSHTRTEFVPMLLVDVKIAYVTDEKTEELASLGVDLTTAKLYEDSLMSLSGMNLLQIPPLTGILRRRMPLRKAYALIADWIASRAKARTPKWAEDAMNRLNSELMQLREFYGANGAGDSSGAECDRRIAEQRAKFTPRIAVDLINAAIVYIPHLRFRAEVQVRATAVSRTFDVDIDPNSGTDYKDLVAKMNLRSQFPCLVMANPTSP